MENQRPYIINFPKIGEPSQGYISVAENGNLPFVPKRVYWTYYTPEDVERGGHAHFELEQILIAVAGSITVSLEFKNGEQQVFVLDSPTKGLFVPVMCWHTMKYTHNAVQVSIANMEYAEEDYIREYDKFKKQP